MAIGDDQVSAAYFMRRLAETRQTQGLTAKIQFDLARSPLSDDQLEDIVDQFRDSPRPRSGWGLSEVLQQVLSREPKRIPVSDLKALQNNLIAGGYAPTDAVANGVWDPSWYAAFRRFDRDNFETQRAGNHWYSAPVESGMRALVNTLPSRVFQGIVGAAKGLVQQAPETAERVGLAGGALAGGGIGLAVGGPIGGAIGAGIGGAIGFFSDLLGEDEGEEDQSFGGALLDALSPWEEYRDNPKAAWEDLGFVLTAASVASGVGAAARGVSGGLAAIRGAQLTEAAGAKAIIGAGADLAPTTVGMAPGSWVKAALLPSKAAGQTELGVVGSLTRAAVARTRLLPGSQGAVVDWIAKYSPIAFANRLGPKIALDVFGGLSQAQMGARLFGGIGQGSKEKFTEAKNALQATLGRDLTEEELDELSKKTATSTIEKAIATSPQLKSGVEIPLLGDMVDLAAFMLYPNKLLPFSGHKAAIAANNILGADHLLLAYAHTIQDAEKISLTKALAKAKEIITPTENTRLRMEFGINSEAALRVQHAFSGKETAAFRRGALPKARADVIRDMRAELARSGTKGESETLKRVMALSEADPTSFEAWLKGLNAQSRGLDRLGANNEVNRLSRNLQTQINREKAIVVRDEDGLPKIVWPQDTSRVRTRRGSRAIDVMAVERRISELERKAGRLEKYAERGAISPSLSMTARTAARARRMEIASLKRTLDELKRANRKELVEDAVRIAPARADFLDKQTILAKRDEFTRLRDEVINAPTDSAKTIARQNMENYVRDLEADGIIPERLIRTALLEKPGTAIAVELGRQAKGAAARFEVPPQIEEQFAKHGYKLVETGEDVLFPDQLEAMMELVGVGDYTRRAAFWESLGLSTIVRKDRSIGELKNLAIKTEVADVLRQHKVKLSAQAVVNRLTKYLDEINHEGAVWGPFRKGKSGKPGLYLADPRDLSFEHVFAALEDVPGMTPESAKDIYGALRRGAAFGHETSLLHPLDTFRGLTHALRINGLPGMGDLMRTLNADVPMRLNRRAWKMGEVRYKPTAELARSPERRRVETALDEIALRSQTNITPGQKTFTMALMDSAVEAQVRQGRFASVDEAYGHIDARFAERYAPGTDGQRLFRVGPNRRPYEELRRLALEFKDSDDWYERASYELSDLFSGMNKEIELLNGKRVKALDLMTQLIAATSPQKNPLDNFEEALKVFNAYVTDGVFPGSLPNVKGMVGDILNGKTIDTWGPPVGPGKRPESVVLTHGRPKVWNFYHNLLGKLDHVTVDTWMGRLFDLRVKDKVTKVLKESDDVSGGDYQFIEREIRRVATETGMYPAQVQAALWTAVKHEAAEDILRDAVALEARGVKAGDLRARAARIEDARSYADLINEPKIAAQLEQLFDNLNGYALLQKVEDRVNGMTEFGPDFESVMTFFRTGDFATLVHENAHVLRRLVSDEDLAQLERAYGVRRAASPEGASDELRQVAAEYHESSGVPLDRSAVDEYVDVDEARAKRIADAYEKLTSNKSAPTKRAYKAFVNETMAQYRALQARGYKLVPWAGEGQPYKNAHEFITDVRENKRLYYFKTTPDQIPADHPLAASSGVKVLDSAGKPYEQSYNDVFRAVHDIFGHAKEGLQTGARGEENAWRQHARMYSREARKAMTTETRGQNSWVNFGPHLRQEGGMIPKKGEPGFVRPQDRPYAQQKAALLPDEFSELDYPFGWPREAEERFARDAERYILGKAKLGDAQFPAAGAMRLLEHAIGSLWKNARPVAVETNAVPRAARRVMDKHFGEALKLVPDSRTSVALRDLRSKQVLGGAALGAAAGAIEGDEGDRLGDALRGAAIGAAGGLVGRKALVRTAGYLPDALARMNTALRYTLSFTFDLGRYTEQNMLAMTKYNLPPMSSPVKWIKSKKGLRSPFRAGEVTGQAAWDDAVRFYDEIHGTTWFQNIDDLDRRMYQAGMLGFSPRNWEVAQAFQLYQRGMKSEDIVEAVAQIGRYGTGRTAIEKSANFIVFPFSFSKKLISTLGDFVLQHPGRNLLLHEGLRRYEESEYDEKVQDFLDKHAPLLKELWTVNNLAFGISPGRFFLQGLSDHRSGTGKAAQLLASFFVPSGAATSLAEAAGNAADWAVNAFTPLVITGESINRAGGIDGLEDVFRRYVPFIRELDQYFLGSDGRPGAFGEQLTALTEGAAPYYQFSEYMDERRRMKAAFEPFAMAMGYSSVDGLLSSEYGTAIKAQLDSQTEALNQKYPTGFRMSQEFTNQDALDEQALVDLANKADRSAAEDHVLEISQHITMQKYIGEIVGFDPQLTQMTTAQSVRALAAKFAGDRRFLELWDRFFLREYGPIRRVA